MFDYKFEGKWENVKYRFTAFEGLQSRMGSYTSQDKNELSDGTVNLSITSSLESMEPTKEQIQTINWISFNGEIIKESIFQAVKEYYVEMKRICGYDSNDPDQQTWFPELNSSNDLGRAMGVGNIRISLLEKQGHCIFNLECGCTWDEEHGLGIKMHKDKVLKIGDAGSCLSEGESVIKSFTGEYSEIYENAGKKNKERMEIWTTNPLDERLYEEPTYYKNKHPKYNSLNPNQIESNKRYGDALIYGGYTDKFKEGVKMGIIVPNSRYLNLAITYCRTDILNVIKEYDHKLIGLINKKDNNGLTNLDKVYNNLIRRNHSNSIYLGKVDELIDWLKENGGKTSNDL